MFRLEMLPARCGDCLLLEYGPPGASRLVVIDGGLGETAAVLWNRLEGLRHERGAETLEIELLVVTHIDNDHIVGIIELLKAGHPTLKIHDIWFNGRPQLMGLPAAGSTAGVAEHGGTGLPGDLLGGADAGTSSAAAALPTPADLLGPRQGDALSGLLAARKLPWNAHPLWQGRAIMVSEQAALPLITLGGGLRLTVLGPTFPRLYKLWQGWLDGQMDKIKTTIASFEKAAPGFGDRVDIGTIGLACALSYLDFRFPGFDWRAAAPATAAWYRSFDQRPSMVATQLKG